jgi:hypothetical protein
VRPGSHASSCRAGAANTRPGSQAVRTPAARRRSALRREAPAATARATASKVKSSTGSSLTPSASGWRGLRPGLVGTLVAHGSHVHSLCCHVPTARYGSRKEVSIDDGDSQEGRFRSRSPRLVNRIRGNAGQDGSAPYSQPVNSLSASHWRRRSGPLQAAVRLVTIGETD